MLGIVLSKSAKENILRNEENTTKGCGLKKRWWH